MSLDLKTHEIAPLLARIAAEAGKIGGKPVIRGRRVTPAMVLNMLANGVVRDEILKAHPVLEPEAFERPKAKPPDSQFCCGVPYAMKQRTGEFN